MAAKDTCFLHAVVRVRMSSSNALRHSCQSLCGASGPDLCSRLQIKLLRRSTTAAAASLEIHTLHALQISAWTNIKVKSALFIALLTIQIVSKQLSNIRIGK